MGTLIDFIKAPATDDDEAICHVEAEIIIFPGVRREHHEARAKEKKRRTKPKRDRLELPD